MTHLTSHTPCGLSSQRLTNRRWNIALRCLTNLRFVSQSGSVRITSLLTFPLEMSDVRCYSYISFGNVRCLCFFCVRCQVSQGSQESLIHSHSSHILHTLSSHFFTLSWRVSLGKSQSHLESLICKVSVSLGKFQSHLESLKSLKSFKSDRSMGSTDR